MLGVPRSILVAIVAVVLVIPVESRAAPSPEPKSESVPPPEATPKKPPPNHARKTKPERAKKTGFGMIVAGTAMASFSVPAVIVTSLLVAEVPNEVTGGMLGTSALVLVGGAALITTGADRYTYSHCPAPKSGKTGFGMIVSGTALTSLGTFSVILGGLTEPWSSPLAGPLLGIGGLSAASGIALIVTGAVRRKHRPCWACTRLSPLVSFDPRGGRVGIVLRF
jgi:hypothetical protein